jgi:hypothetical protein
MRRVGQEDLNQRVFQEKYQQEIVPASTATSMLKAEREA